MRYITLVLFALGCGGRGAPADGGGAGDVSDRATAVDASDAGPDLPAPGECALQGGACGGGTCLPTEVCVFYSGGDAGTDASVPDGAVPSGTCLAVPSACGGCATCSCAEPCYPDECEIVPEGLACHGP